MSAGVNWNLNGLGLLGLCGLIFSAGNVAPAQTNSASISFEFKRGHIMVPAKVNGSNSIWLMLDTGFSITIIDPRLAESLKLRPTGNTTIAGIAGEERADVFEGPTFDFSGLTYTPRRVAALPSERKRRRRRMEGVLGSGFFRRYVVEINSDAKIIKLHEPKEYQYSGPGEILPLKLSRGAPAIEAVINIPGRAPLSGRFEIDTGCDGGLCLGHDFVEANKLLEVSGSTKDGGRSGVGGETDTKEGFLPELQLGHLTIKKPAVNFFLKGSPVEHGYAGHIGMEVLRQFKMIFDYSRQRLILESKQ